MKNPVWQLVKKPTLKLTKAQTDLYSLICDKLATNKPLEYEEVKQIYISKACQQVRDGKVYWYNYYHHKNEKDEWEGGVSFYSEDVVKNIVFCWLTFNIGKLVMKGALKIIPQIQLT